MAITQEARNYRGLRHVLWTPSGVSALVGPNGSGKSTLLALFAFFRDVYVSGFQAAVESQGGPWGLRHLEAPAGEPVTVAVTVNELRWGLEFWHGEGPSPPTVKERLTRGDDGLIPQTEVGSPTFSYRGSRVSARDGYHTGLRSAYDSIKAAQPELEPLVTAVKNFRLYQGWNLSGLRRNSSPSAPDLHVNPTGENAFSVLRNWHSRHSLRPRYEFVVQGLGEAFPELCDNLDFNFTGSATTVEMNRPGGKEAIPAAFTPNGWLTALLHLCAVAGGEPGSLVAIDEMENTLHPYAIRKLVQCFREWSGEHDLTVCLATHSGVLLNEFKEQPENVFVMEPGEPTLPVPLTKIHDPEWLAHFALGDLYAYGEFGDQNRHPVQSAQTGT
jgi:predicted ATPase